MSATTTNRKLDNDSSGGGWLLATSATVAAVTAGYVAWIQFRRRLENKKPFGDDIPTPPGSHWLVGHPSPIANPESRAKLRETLKEHSNEYGQVGVWLFNYPTLFVSSWQDARTVLRQEHYKLSIKLFERHGEMFFGRRNVVTLQGREWKYHRSVVLKAFSPSIVQANRQTIANVTKTAVTSVLSRIKNNNKTTASSSANGTTTCTTNGVTTTATTAATTAATAANVTTMEIEHLCKLITMDVFGQVAFTKDLECTTCLKPSRLALAFEYLEKEFVRRIGKGIFNPLNLFYWLPTKANMQHKQQRTLLRSFLSDVITERKNNTAVGVDNNKEKKYNDLLSGYLDALQDEDEDVDKIVSDALLVLLFAGYDTTSVTLSYALCLISQNPDVEETMLKEIKNAANKAKNKSPDDPDELKYCEAAIYESLRLYPAAGATQRYLQKPLKLQGGFVAPAHTNVMVSIWSIQHNPKYWPEAEQFRPDRWVKFDENNNRWVDREETDESGTIPAANRNAFFAFSAGARSCAGQNLAMQEGTIILANLIQSLKFRPVDGYVLKPSGEGIILAPVDHLPMHVEERL